jgi:hypothetical protein
MVYVLGSLSGTVSASVLVFALASLSVSELGYGSE